MKKPEVLTNIINKNFIPLELQSCVIEMSGLVDYSLTEVFLLQITLEAYTFLCLQHSIQYYFAYLF